MLRVMRDLKGITHIHTQRNNAIPFKATETLAVKHLAVDEEFLSPRSKQPEKKEKKNEKEKKKTQERTEEEKEEFCRLPDGKATLTFSFLFFFFPPLELNHTTPEQQQ